MKRLTRWLRSGECPGRARPRAVAALAGAFGQRAPFPIPDPDPEIERKSFVVADGFEVNLFAADPLIAKPLQMNFDPAGRLWIASSEVYPQIKPGAVADDKVLIVEDRDDDGRADKTTVFARRAVDPDRHRAGRRRGLRGQQHRALALQRHRRRRQGRRRPASSSRASAPKTPTTSCTPCGGAMTGCSTSISRSIFTAISKRRTACAGWAAAGSGSFGPRRWSSRSSSGGWSIPGGITSTAGASRSPPTGRGARGSTIASRVPITSRPPTPSGS